MKNNNMLYTRFQNSLKLIFSLIQKILSDEWGKAVLEEAVTFSPLVFSKKKAFSFFLIESFFEKKENIEMFKNIYMDSLYLPCKEEILLFSKKKLGLYLIEKNKEEHILNVQNKIESLLEKLNLSEEEEEFLLKAFKETAEHFFFLIGNSKKTETLFYMKDLKKASEKNSPLFNSYDLEKILSGCIEEALEKGDKSLSQKTIYVLNTIDSSNAKNNLIHKLFDQVLVIRNNKKKEPYSLDKIIEFIEGMQREEQDLAFERLILFLAKHEQGAVAHRMTKRLKDREIKDYTLSALVQRLSEQGLDHIPRGLEMSMEIEDEAYRIDALSSLLKAYLNAKAFEEAVAFVEQIQNPSIRIELLKILHSGAISSKNQAWEMLFQEKFL